MHFKKRKKICAAVLAMTLAAVTAAPVWAETETAAAGASFGKEIYDEASEEAVDEAQTIDEPVGEDLVKEEQIIDEPAVDYLNTQESVSGEHEGTQTIENPVSDEPMEEEQTIEEPVSGEQIDEEQTIEEQIIEEQTNENILLYAESSRNGWVYQKINEDTKEYWYYYENGSYVGPGGGDAGVAWRKINGKWYCFDNTGHWLENDMHNEDDIVGIDVSYYNGNIDWSKVKADGYQFAFLRVGYGSHDSGVYHHVTDKKFHTYAADANAVGIPIGTYVYCYAQSVDEAVADADFAIEQMQGYRIDYPVVIDLEDSRLSKNLDRDTITDMAVAFCDRVREAGYTPMVYCNENWYANYIDTTRLSDVDFWIARYNRRYNVNYERTIWQCSSKGRVSGIEGNVDIDFCYRDYTNIGLKEDQGSWVLENENWYFADAASGELRTGWIYVNRNWYYLDPESGKMQTDWQQVDDRWYYLSPGSGAMATGWAYVGNKWYYLDPSSGEMKTGRQKINGRWYRFNSSGVWIS